MQKNSLLQSRRGFLKCAVAAVATGAVLGGAKASRAIGYDKPVPGQTETGKGFCPFCQVRCTYTAHLEDGKIVSLEGEKNNHWTGGAMCPKGMSMVELLQSPYRVVEPMRKLPDGSWEKISYDQAVQIVVDAMEKVRKEHGAKAADRVAITMPLWDCLESEIAALMAIRCTGSVCALPPGETCVSTASIMLGNMIGVNSGSVQVDELPKAKTIVLWGANVSDLYPVYSRWLMEARKAGADIIYIDPRITRTSRWATTQLRPIPGTDGVLARGAIRYVLDHPDHNEERARFHIEDYEVLRDQVQKFTPEFVAKTTGLSPEEIDNFYKAIAESPAMIGWIGGSLSRQTNGISTTRAIIILQALTDNLIGDGKGILTFQSGKPGGGDELVDHFFGESKAQKMTARKLRNSMEKGRLDILFLNSSYRRYPDALGMRKAIENVPLVVHMGYFPDEEMEVCNLFIPATFGPETSGTGYGNENQVAWREQLVEAPGTCVPAWKFYRDIGRKLEPEKYPNFESPADLVKLLNEHVPSWKGLTVDRMRNAATVSWPVTEVDGPERTGSVFVDGKLLTPNSMMQVQDKVFGGLDKWEHPKSHPHGNDGTPDFPLILTQGKELWHWQQTYTNFTNSMGQFSNGRYVSIHPETARALNLQQKDKVKLETSAGALDAWVNVTDTVLPGVVFTPAHFCRTTPIEANNSPSICNILPNNWDRISAQHNGTACRLSKV